LADLEDVRARLARAADCLLAHAAPRVSEGEPGLQARMGLPSWRILNRWWQ
jgi:hypothetical protein